MSELQPLWFVVFGVLFFPMRKGFTQQLGRAIWGWLGLCLCHASSFCANVMGTWRKVSLGGQWSSWQEAGGSGVGLSLRVTRLVRCLCKGIWLSEGFPLPCSGERGLLRSLRGVGSSRLLQGRGKEKSGILPLQRLFQHTREEETLTESADEGNQLISLTVPAPHLRFPVSV